MKRDMGNILKIGDFLQLQSVAFYCYFVESFEILVPHSEVLVFGSWLKTVGMVKDLVGETKHIDTRHKRFYICDDKILNHSSSHLR